jgi:hypothetical protein
MANINDFKLLNVKCTKYFTLLQKELALDEKEINKFSDIDKKRFGFYLFMLENICDIRDLSDLIPIITDKEFNSMLFSINFDDHGVDAVYINKENFEILLFNFKFREKFNNGGQKINEAIVTSKFLDAIDLNDTKGLNGKLKDYANEIITHLHSDDIWKLKLYVISNELDILKPEDTNLKNFAKKNDLVIIPIGLPYIADIMSIKPNDINAKIIVDKESILTYSEDGISTSKSYVIKLPLDDLIRITCNDEELRKKYNLENINELADTNVDLSVLFDNVRGFVTKSKYNTNIEESIKIYPEKFFMFNNGITIIAKDIKVNQVNANKKFLIELKAIQIVNGGQTLRSIHKFNSLDTKNIVDYLSKAEVLVRLFLVDEQDDTKNKIAEYTNSQNSIYPVDLKSLRPEQIQLEQYLNEKNIIYSRKTGDTGLDDAKTYTHKISMERFGQLLYSLQGFPEKASNQKKQIFDKKYNEIFGEPNFILEESDEIINKYFEIKNIYEKSEFEVSDQKIFYILYLNKNIANKPVIDIIQFLETNLNEFGQELDTTNARKLIRSDFKDFIDTKIFSK